jgi:antitoxin component YwqK of YwqJK toxin-antitoxin module
MKDIRSDDDPQFNGKCTKYYPSGKLWQQGGYNMNKPHGKFISYYENGKIEAIGEYYYGKKYNLWKNYDKDGTILSITKYDQYGYEIGIPRNELTEEEITKLNFKFN